MADEKQEGHESGAAAQSGGGSKLVPLLIGVNTLVTIAMTVVLFLSFQKEKKKTSIEDIAVSAPAEAGGHGEAKKEGDAHGGGHGAAAEHGDAKKDSDKKAAEFGKMVALESFTVNLSTPGSATPKFARVNVSIEVPNGDTETEVTSKMPQVRNVIIDLFNSKRPSDLSSAEGRDYLKEEIRNAINGFMITGKVKGVFFTNFSMSS